MREFYTTFQNNSKLVNFFKQKLIGLTIFKLVFVFQYVNVRAGPRAGQTGPLPRASTTDHGFHEASYFYHLLQVLS